jgi:hypothetical protein
MARGNQRLPDEGQLVGLQPRPSAARTVWLDAEIIVVAPCHDGRFGRAGQACKSKINRSKYSVETSALARGRQSVHCASLRKSTKYQLLERTPRRSTLSENPRRAAFRNGNQRADNLLRGSPARIENPLYLALNPKLLTAGKLSKQDAPIILRSRNRATLATVQGSQ